MFDLLVLNREAHAPTLREAAVSSAVWIAIGLGFSLVVLAWLGVSAAGQYLTGYVVEESLSVDNVFVWAVILGYFAVPRRYQHRVLFWGVFGALALRAGFIFAGVALLERFSWVELIFGAFLVITAVRVGRQGETEVHPERNLVLRLFRRFVPVTDGYRGTHFLVREPRPGSVVTAGSSAAATGAGDPPASGGPPAGRSPTLRTLATPLLVVLVLVEATDVLFAVDSVPAILAVSRQQFIVFSSNALAILGLRALYFLVSSASDSLVHLNKGLAVILGFVGLKMLAARWLDLPTWLSLAVVAAVLAVTVAVSLLTARRAANGAAARETAS
jgi:tellurite resistance protein TerC